MKLKPEKNSGLNGIRTHDLCDTGAVLYQAHMHQSPRLGIQSIHEFRPRFHKEDNLKIQQQTILGINHLKPSPVLSLSSGMTVTIKLAIAATTKPITTTFFRPNLRKKYPYISQAYSLGFQKVLGQIPPKFVRKRTNYFSEKHKESTILLRNKADLEIGSDNFSSNLSMRDVLNYIWLFHLVVYCKVCSFFSLSSHTT